MREIACTSLGRNALSTGLVSHVSALAAGMMTVSGAWCFSVAASLFACLAFLLGAQAELRERGYEPVRRWCFALLASAVAALPVIGPLAVLLTLYAVQGSRVTGPFTVPGLLLSIPKLKANPLVLFFFLAILFVFFALSVQQQDPYFKKAVMRKSVSLHEQHSGPARRL